MSTERKPMIAVSPRTFLIATVGLVAIFVSVAVWSYGNAKDILGAFETVDHEKQQIPTWGEGMPFQLLWVPQGSEPFHDQGSVGEGHPVLGVAHPEVHRWIQIVSLNSAPIQGGDFEGPGSSMMQSDGGDWIYVDTTKRNRERGIPFFWTEPLGELRLGHFYDAPSYHAPESDRGRVWGASLFGVKLQGKKVIPIGGLRWGFSQDKSDSKPTAMPVTYVDRGEWERYLPSLRREFKDWTFE